MSITDDIRRMKEPILAQYERAYVQAIERNEYPDMVSRWQVTLGQIREEIRFRRVFRQEPTGVKGFGVAFDHAPF